MRKCIIIVIGLFVDISACLCYNYFSYGAVSDALAGYTSTTIGIWQVWGNQAGIADIQSPVLTSYYRQRFMLSELADKSIGVVYPTRPLHMSFSWQIFGNNSYRENRITLGTARKFGENFYGGLRFNRYNTYMSQGLNQYVMYNVDAGIINRLHENFILGCYIHSLIPTKVRKGQDNLLPTIMGIGVAYTISTNIQVMSEMQLTGTSRYSWIGALQVKPSDRLFIFTGAQIHDYAYNISFGFNYRISNYELGLAVVQHPQLGINPSLQISYSFGRK